MIRYTSRGYPLWTICRICCVFWFDYCNMLCLQNTLDKTSSVYIYTYSCVFFEFPALGDHRLAGWVSLKLLRYTLYLQVGFRRYRKTTWVGCCDMLWLSFKDIEHKCKMFYEPRQRMSRLEFDVSNQPNSRNKSHPNHSFVKVNDNEKVLTMIKLKWRGFIISTFSRFGFIPVASKSDAKRLQQQFSTLIPGACGLSAGGLCCVNPKMQKQRSYNFCTLTHRQSHIVHRNGSIDV